MKKLLLITLTLIILSSCANEEFTVDNENGILIRTITKFTSNGIIDSTFEYEYNSNGNISKITSNSSYGENITSFEYDSNSIMTSFTEVMTEPFGDIRTEINNFEYVDDLVVQICQDITYSDYTYDNPEVDKIQFNYNSSQFVDQFTHYYSEDSDSNTCDDVSYIEGIEKLEYDSNGNMIRYENSDYFWIPSYLTYTYDNKNHPLANIKPDSYREIIGSSFINNISTATEYNLDTGEILGNITYTYSFNSNDFPLTLEKKYTSTDGFTSTTSYEYTYY